MFEQIITHFVSSFTECIWIKTFLYSITFVVLSTFWVSLLQVHFSASMLHLFSELWWKKTIIRKSLNWIITLLWNYYKKSWGKVDNRAETKMRMKWSIEIIRPKYFETYYKIKYFDRITSATEVNDEIISLNVHVCVMVYNSIIILLIIDDVSLHSNYKATRLHSFTNSS